MAPRAKSRKATESNDNSKDQVAKPPAVKRGQSTKKSDNKINIDDQVVSKKKASANKGGKIDNALQSVEVNGGADVEVVKGKRGKRGIDATVTVETTKTSEIIEHEKNAAGLDANEESVSGNGRKTVSKKKISKKTAAAPDTQSKQSHKEEAKVPEKKTANLKTETKRKGKNVGKDKEVLLVNEPQSNGNHDEAEPLVNGKQDAKISPEKKAKSSKKVTATKIEVSSTDSTKRKKQNKEVKADLANLRIQEVEIDSTSNNLEELPAKPSNKRGKRTASESATVSNGKSKQASEKTPKSATSKIEKETSNKKKRADEKAEIIVQPVEVETVEPTTKRKRAKAENQKEEKPSKKAPVAPEKPKRGRKRVIPREENDDIDDGNDSDFNPAAIKKTKKPAVKPKATGKGPKLNATSTDYSKIDLHLDKEFNLKICSWNVAGLRALVNKNGFEYFDHEKPDIICLQEIKCLSEEVPEAAKLKGYHQYWNSKPGGHGGVAIYSKTMAYHVQNGFSVNDDEDDGRIITAEFEKFYLVCVYVPNAGRKLVTLPTRLTWNKRFEQHITELNEKKPVIISGDMNVAHTEIDLANPKTNTKNAGFTPEERAGMDDLLSLGYVDTFRHFYPKEEKVYTFWSYMGQNRTKNVGWRLDYYITSTRFVPKVVDNVIRSPILGSDHCPIVLFLNL